MRRLTVITACFLVVSCSNLKKQPPQQESNVPVAPMSDARAQAREAFQIAQSEDQPETIIGSSSIDAPTEHHSKTYYLYGAEHLKLDNYYFDIPVVYNAKVKKWINYFLSRGRGYFERYSARAGRYAPLMGKILEDNGLPRDLIFLAMAESGFQNKAKSWAAAVGPWQFMPYTGRRYGLHIDWYVDERRDPIKATVAAAKYLKKLYGDFESWELAAAAYNAGEGKMSRAIRRYRTENFWRLTRGRYLKSETKNYVPKIMALAIIGKNLKAFGFENIDFNDALDFEEIEVPGNTDVYKVAETLGVEFEEMQYLNPEILRWFTPPSASSYRLRVPVGKKTAWSDCCSDKSQTFAVTNGDLMEYQIKGRRSRLRDVAHKFKIKPKFSYVLEKLNGTSIHRKYKRGEVVYLPFKKGQNIKDNMYADLYEKPRKSVIRRRKYRKRIRMALKRGKRIRNPKAFYTVRRGDSLWTVARKNGISLDSLIASNVKIIKRRQIRAGDKLVVR